MKKLQPLAAALCLGTLGTFLVDSSLAHHSFQATYNLDETIEIQGTLVQFNFRNPHASVMIDVVTESGETERWGIEWGGASLLTRQGLTRDSFRPGDKVVVTGQSAWNPDDNRLRMESILRPLDDFGWGFDESQTFD